MPWGQPSPTVKEQSHRLNDVVGLPDGTAWAVGGRSRTVMRTIVQRPRRDALANAAEPQPEQDAQHDGSTWAEAPRDESTEPDWLEAVDATADGTAWAVGYHSTSPQTSYVLRRTCS